MRSKLGGHYAGMGMSHDIYDNTDSYKNLYTSVPMDTDKLKGKDFKKYCEEMSGKVKVYNIKDLKK